MKKVLFFISMLAVMLASCADNHSDELLKTVPANSTFVIMAHLDKMVSKLDDEGWSQLAKAVPQLTEKTGRFDARWNYFFSDESEVDFSYPLVAFNLDRAIVFTFYVKNPDRFRKQIQEKTETEFEVVDGISVCAGNTVFVRERQVWFTASYPRVDASDIAPLALQEESKSFLIREVSHRLIESQSDIVAVVNLVKSLEGAWLRNERMAINLLFDNPGYMVSNINFTNLELTGESIFVNARNEPSPLALKTEPLEADSLKNFNGRGNIFGAVSVDSTTVAGLLPLLGNLGHNPPFARELNGPLAVAAMVKKDSDFPALSLMLSFSSPEGASACAEYLRDFLPVADGEAPKITAEGCRCIVEASTGGEGRPFSSVASELDGANLAALFLPSFLQETGNPEIAQYMEQCLVKITEKDSGAVLSIQLKNTPGHNSLISLLELLNRI